MPETLSLADGNELSLDEAQREFDRAMAAPEPTEPEAPAPKRRERREPAEGKPEHSKPRVSGATPGKAPGRPGRASKASSAPAPKDYTEDLTGLLQLAYGAAAATGNLADAGAIKVHGPQMVAAWNAAAQENSYARKGIEFLTKGGVWGAVIVSTMPFALQVMANHNQVPIEKVAALGVKDPNVLAIETEADIREMAEMAAAA